MYYKNITSFNNLTYSIDMLRLKTYIDYDKFSDLDFYLKTYYNDKINRFWISDRIMNFKYNYHIELGEGKSFYLSFHHNNEKAEDHNGLHNLTIEFNPNKLKDNNIILHILNLSSDWFLRSYDLAVDLKVNILDIIVDKGLKRKCLIFSSGFDNKTYEIGSGDKRIKIYNKKFESNLDINYDLTRIEISRKYDDFPVSNIRLLKFGADNFPELYLNNYICSLSDYQDKTLYAIVYAVQNGYPINDLSRRYKERITKLFEGGSKIKFNDNDATQVLHQTIFAYFIGNSKVRWN